MRISRRWWDQISIDILGMITAHAAAEMGEEIGKQELEGDRDQDTEGQKEGGRLEEPDNIRQILGGEVIDVAHNPLGTVPNAPLASAPGKE